jgi:putative membrane protein
MARADADKLKNNPKWYDNKNWFSFLFRGSAYHFPGMVASVILMGLITGAVTFLEAEYGFFGFKFPPFFHTVLGLVIGLLLVFRTNTAYDRWWEGRKQLGMLVNTSRSLGIKFEAYLEGRNYAGKPEIALFIPAFAWAMKEHLRAQDFSLAARYLPAHSLRQFARASHKPNFILLEISRHIRRMKDQGAICGEQLLALENDMSVLANVLGACERIRNTPIPMGYALHLKRILLIYMLTLPIAFLDSNMHWWASVPFAMIVFYTMVGIELIGEEIEDPFGTDPNDLPFDALEDKIRANIQELLSFEEDMEEA